MKHVIKTSKAPQAIGPYSQAVLAGNLLFVSGQIGLDPETQALVSDDFSKQAEQVLRNIESIVMAAGGRVIDVMRLTVYVTDLAYFDAFNEVIKTAFSEPYPARAVVEVSRLPKDALVEIEAIALLD